MKELTIEEKAKRYDEAIKVAKDSFNYPDYPGFIRADVVFPELKESEDERIRKEMLQIAKESEDSFYMVMTPNKRKRLIAWLEKQGETFTKKDVDDAYLKGIADKKNEIEKQYEANYQIRKDIATFILNYRGNIKDRAKWIDYLGIKVSFVEKQDKQNPCETCEEPRLNCQNFPCERKKNFDSANKVEPKFKIGDWIVRGKTIAQILDIQEQYYVGLDINGNDFTSSRFLSDDKIHLWTIKDAKDGDVLVVNNEVFIYAHRKQLYSIAVAHCFIDSADGFHLDGEFGYTEKGYSVHPATKEQRDTLERAITNAGYRWDKEKLKLEKV